MDMGSLRNQECPASRICFPFQPVFAPIDAVMPLSLNLSFVLRSLHVSAMCMWYPCSDISPHSGAYMNAKRWKILLDPSVSIQIRILHKTAKQRCLMHSIQTRPSVWRWIDRNHQVSQCRGTALERAYESWCFLDFLHVSLREVERRLWERR
jgi:hypothetical protein